MVQKCFKNKQIFIFIIIGLICFGIGYGFGSSRALNLCINAAEKLLDVKFKSWVIPEVIARLGGLNIFE